MGDTAVLPTKLLHAPGGDKSSDSEMVDAMLADFQSSEDLFSPSALMKDPFGDEGDEQLADDDDFSCLGEWNDKQIAVVREHIHAGNPESTQELLDTINAGRMPNAQPISLQQLRQRIELEKMPRWHFEHGYSDPITGPGYLRRHVPQDPESRSMSAKRRKLPDLSVPRPSHKSKIPMTRFSPEDTKILQDNLWKIDCKTEEGKKVAASVLDQINALHKNASTRLCTMKQLRNKVWALKYAGTSLKDASPVTAEKRNKKDPSLRLRTSHLRPEAAPSVDAFETLSAVQERVRALENQMGDVKARGEERAKQLEHIVKETKAQLEEKDQQCTELKSALEEARAMIKQQGSEIDEYAREIVRWMVKSEKTNEALRINNISLQRQKDSMSIEIQKLTTQRDDAMITASGSRNLSTFDGWLAAGKSFISLHTDGKKFAGWMETGEQFSKEVDTPLPERSSLAGNK